jgi:hypothetical protein
MDYYLILNSDPAYGDMRLARVHGQAVSIWQQHRNYWNPSEYTFNIILSLTTRIVIPLSKEKAEEVMQKFSGFPFKL